MTKNNTQTQKETGFAAWRRQNRSNLQTAALLLAIVTPLGLYWAAHNGQNALAGLFFGLFAFSMLLTASAG